MSKDLKIKYPLNEMGASCKTKRAFYIRLKDGTKYPVCKHIKPIFKQEGNKVFVEKWKFKELYKREWVEVTTESIEVFIEVEYKKIENKKPWLQKKIYPKPVKMFEMKS